MFNKYSAELNKLMKKNEKIDKKNEENPKEGVNELKMRAKKYCLEQV